MKFDNKKSKSLLADTSWLDKLTEIVTDNRVVAAMESIPRAQFIPEKHVHMAEEDKAIPIGYNQTISQPTLVGRMLEEASIRNRDSVMEIGSGSGYV